MESCKKSRRIGRAKHHDNAALLSSFSCVATSVILHGCTSFSPSPYSSRFAHPSSPLYLFYRKPNASLVATVLGWDITNSHTLTVFSYVSLSFLLSWRLLSSLFLLCILSLPRLSLVSLSLLSSLLFYHICPLCLVSFSLPSFLQGTAEEHLQLAPIASPESENDTDRTDSPPPTFPTIAACVASSAPEQAPSKQQVKKKRGVYIHINPFMSTTPRSTIRVSLVICHSDSDAYRL